jgi:hypothetical protein
LFTGVGVSSGEEVDEDSGVAAGDSEEELEEESCDLFRFSEADETVISEDDDNE